MRWVNVVKWKKIVIHANTVFILNIAQSLILVQPLKDTHPGRQSKKSKPMGYI
jgi:hypothetical protein